MRGARQPLLAFGQFTFYLTALLPAPYGITIGAQVNSAFCISNSSFPIFRQKARPRSVTKRSGGGSSVSVLFYSSTRSRWADFRALLMATPRMGAKTTATRPLNTEEGTFCTTAAQAAAESSPAMSIPL